jgi:hypothetical protein
MPTRGELRVSAPQAAISSEMKGMDERQFYGAGYCDEIVNNTLLEIATGRGSCFRCLEAESDNCGVE